MGKEVLGIHQEALQPRLSCAKRYSDEQKRVILHAVLVKGMPKSCAAKEFGVSRQIIWKWIRIFAQETGSTSNKKGPQHPLTVQNPIPMPRKNQTPAETPEEELARQDSQRCSNVRVFLFKTFILFLFYTNSKNHLFITDRHKCRRLCRRVH